MRNNIVFTKKKSFIKISVGFILLALFSTYLSANQLQELSLEQKVAASDLVVIGKVKRIFSTSDAKRRAVISILHTLKGDKFIDVVVGPSPTVVHLSDRLGSNFTLPHSTTYLAESEPSWKRGVVFLLFLKKSDINSFYPVNESFGVVEVAVKK
jgi:hypothetical protein